MSSGTGLIIGLILLAGNAFFVGAEFAIMSARRSAIEPLADRGVRGAKTVLWAMENVSLMLACAQLGITVCSTGLGVVAEPALAKLVDAPLIALGAPAEAAHVVGFVLALAIVVYLHVVLGEMVPKNLAVATPERAALWFGPPLVWVSRVLSPVIRALNWIANAMLRLVGVEPKDEVAAAFTAEEVAAIVERSRAEGVLDDEVGLISGAIEFSEATAATVMVPVADLVSVPQGVSPQELESAVTRTGFSRFPVVDDQAQVMGYLHVKDVLYASSQEQRTSAVPAWRVRAMSVASPTDEVESVLTTMQVDGTHMALVKA
ncbi:MAG: hemolysin family protein, partial [Beutenbergiaceae bacterium]